VPENIQKLPRSLIQSTRRVLWLSAIASFLLVVIAAITLVTVSHELNQSRKSHAELDHVRETLEQLQLVLSTLQDAETGERGFVITGKADFLSPYYAAEQSLQGELERLQDLLRNPESLATLQEFDELARRQIAFLRRVIDLRHSQGAEAAGALISQGTGRRQMDQLRALMERLRMQEGTQLAARIRSYQERSSSTEAVVQVSLGAAIGLVLFAGLLLARHIHRRLEAEHAARSTFDLLRETMDNVSQGVAVFDSQQRLVVWNARYVELRGLDPAHIRVNMPMTEVVERGAAITVHLPEGPRDAKSVSRDVDRSIPFESEATRADGMVLLVRGRPVDSRDYIVTYTDITAIKQSELAYRDQATRLTATLDNVLDAIITINESGSIESWSKGAERLFGYAADEVLRRNVRMLMPEPHHSAHDGYIRHYIETGERRIIGARREVEGRHKDGHIVQVDLGISEMRLGSRRMFIGVVRDISARLEVERLKAGFVSTVSHELRTPLTSISGSLGLLAGGVAGQLPAKATRLIEIARLNSDRLVRLINDILDLEKAESGRLDLRLETLSLKQIVRHAIDLNRAFAHGFGVIIELDAGSSDANVFVDHDRLIQVLTNLLSNAAKFSPRGGTIFVTIGTGNDSVRVSIRDQGPGMPEEFRRRIFQKFAQADSSDSRAKGGTGLGLSIAKTIVERLGGSIGFDSEPGKGATFHINLPIRQEARPPAGAEALLAAALPMAPSVLVCEDDPDVSHILAEILRNEGMRAETVGTAKAARAALTAVKYDVVIVDLHLPDADGLEFITELRAHEATRALPVIVVTARSRDPSERNVVHTLQLADWLQKPVNPQRLLDTIRSVLATPRTGRARILHVEDDISLTQLVHELLEDEADVFAANSLAEARHSLNGAGYDLVILDITLGDGSGLDLLPLLHQSGRKPPVILYSATEPSREISDLVEGALVKSRDSVEQLLASVRSLAGR
jgi:PAS domain S-box-containing protein